MRALPTGARAGPGVVPAQPPDALPVGKSELRREGRCGALLAFGSVLAPALAAADQLAASVANMGFG